jgi:hypothetical protein
MTNQQHPITPPPELVTSLCDSAPYGLWETNAPRERWLINCAYRAGADDELEASVTWLDKYGIGWTGLEKFRNARRPKPTTLKEQALEELENMVKAAKDFGFGGTDPTAIRRALEALPND